MKFFDYKFFILLGLALALYFVFREVELIKHKVERIDYELKTKTYETVKKPVDECILEKKSNKNPETIDEQAKKAFEDINKDIDFLAKTYPHAFGTELVSGKVSKPVSPKPVSPKNISVNVNDVTDNATEMSKSHVEIYSNDDELIDDGLNSLLESVEATKQAQKSNDDLQNIDLNILNSDKEDILTKLEETKPEEMKPEIVETKPEETKPEETKPEEMKPEIVETKPETTLNLEEVHQIKLDENDISFVKMDDKKKEKKQKKPKKEKEVKKM